MVAVSPPDRLAPFPSPLTPLIGREREIAAICDRLRSADPALQAALARTAGKGPAPSPGQAARLLTLTGPGGVGKTRLALAVAQRLQAEFRDGVAFVPLQTVAESGLVASAIAQALGVRESRERELRDSLVALFQTRQILLVLDNFEHVLAAAPFVSDLLAACPALAVLVTSRAVLHIYGEHDYLVPPLPLPDLRALPAVETLARVEAVRLFVDRGQAVKSDFALTPWNARSVATICHRLDGLPLAIELAAARLAVLPPQAIADRLDQRLALLTGGPLDTPARLQTLRNTIAWSYDLLSPAEQRFFRRLGVFAGGFTLAAAESLAADDSDLDPLTGIASLVNKSLLQSAAAVDGEPRFGMLETIREFALEHLARHDELDDTRRAHARCYLALAEEAVPHLRGHEQRAWLDRLEAEHDNLRSALTWLAADGAHPEPALRLSGALAWFWEGRGYITEGRRWLAGTLALATDPSPARMQVLYGAGWLAHIQQEAAPARALLEESLAIAHQLGDRWSTAWVLHLLGRVAYFDGDAGQARAFGERSLAVAREAGDDWLIAWAMHLLGLAAHVEADYPAARHYYDESLAIRRRLGYLEGIGHLLQLTAMIAMASGDEQAAATLLREDLAIIQALRARWIVGNLLANVAVLAVRLGRPKQAVLLAGASTALGEMTGALRIPLIERALAQALDGARRALGEDVYQAAWSAGRAIDLDEAIGCALLSLAAPSAARAPAGLSAREVDVLRLLSQGKSNREIGEALFLSVRTVERHVENLYRKIDAHGRAEATAFALRHRLDQS
jgi:non-specific serine/threonine protein kinase